MQLPFKIYDPFIKEKRDPIEAAGCGQIERRCQELFAQVYQYNLTNGVVEKDRYLAHAKHVNNENETRIFNLDTRPRVGYAGAYSHAEALLSDRWYIVPHPKPEEKNEKKKS